LPSRLVSSLLRPTRPRPRPSRPFSSHPASALQPLAPRFFAAREIANLHGFPEAFARGRHPNRAAPPEDTGN
jgi:hypothetical protein